jgi:hypothetical protein
MTENSTNILALFSKKYGIICNYPGNTQADIFLVGGESRFGKKNIVKGMSAVRYIL